MRPTPHRESWLARPPRATVLPPLRPWLTDPDSLTARIRARCGVLTVRVLAQSLGLLHPDEAALLGLRRGQLAWLREVLLIADGAPVVFARTVLPRGALRGAWRMFRSVGGSPLGAALFADPRIARGPLACARLDRRDARYGRVRAALASVSPTEPQTEPQTAEGPNAGNADVAPSRGRPAAGADARRPDLPPGLWARRSVFRQRGRPLLVSEVFLPAILALPR